MMPDFSLSAEKDRVDWFENLTEEYNKDAPICGGLPIQTRESADN
jgi:hypothetical protein